MIKTKLIFLATAAALAATSPVAAAARAPASAPASAPAARPDADPALWVVKDDDTTIYLFGTFHLLDGKRDWFNDEVKTAFDASQELVLEAKLPENMADLQPMVLKYALNPAGELSKKLSPETAAKLATALSAVGAPATAFDKFDPWFAAMTVTALKFQAMGLKAEHGPETILSAAAKAGNKPVSELEGFEYQFKLFDNMPEEQQLAQLSQTLDMLPKSEALLTDMLTAWSTGDADRLATIINEGLASDPKLYNALMTSRNANWAEWVDARLDKPGTVFVAVGTGHLAGKDSVQDLLAKRGIKSARVGR
jgi:uncharacterized protein YbaP (TraB family)